jgi:hypothetical protein
MWRRFARSWRGLDGPDGLELWCVDVVKVRRFVVEVCPRLGRRAAQQTVVALRSLLRFLRLEGELQSSLAGAVPSVAGWRLSGLPKRAEPDQVDALLASCDSSTVIGVRDVAILTVLARLGLRAGEVAGLSVEDIGWRAGELVVRGKGGRAERLPLPHDVGEAIVRYLRDGRPASAQGRTVFVRARAPHCGWAGVGQQCGRDGRAPGRTGPDPCASAAAHGGLRYAPGWRDALGGRSGAPSSPRGEHRDLRESPSGGAPADRASVARSVPMSALRASLGEYLAVRRALGYRLERTEKLLHKFLDHLDAMGADRITVERAVAWVILPRVDSTGTRCGWERSTGSLATSTKSTHGSKCLRLTLCPTGQAARSPTSIPIGGSLS